MAEAIILEFEGVVAEQYWAVNGKLGIDMVAGTGDYPDGLITHWGGRSDGGTFVVGEVWESREAQGAFMESRLGQALADGGIAVVPKITWVSLVAHQEPGA